MCSGRRTAANCTPAPPPYIFTGQFGVMITGFYERGPVFSAPIYTISTGTCMQLSPGTNVYYELGAPVDIAPFAEATVVRE